VDAHSPSGTQVGAPQVGDRLQEVAGFRTRTFVDFANALAWVRSPPADAAIGNLYPVTDPREAADNSINVLQDDRSSGGDDRSHRRYVKVQFWSNSTLRPETAWVLLERQPIGGLALSLGWFLLHTIVFTLAGLAYWRRPYDRP